MKKRILFNKVPEDTQYRKDQWSWVSEPTASLYIRDGYGVEYDPKKGKKKPKKKKVEKETIIPENNGE